MNLFDILIWAILIYALWRGWSGGLFMQLSGIVGIITGAWIGSELSDIVCELFNIEGGASKIIVFLIVIIGVVIGVTILLKLLGKIFEWSGLGGLVKLLGSLFCATKYFILIALMLSVYYHTSSLLNHDVGDDKVIKESFFNKPLNGVSGMIFPYIAKGLNLDNEVKESKIESGMKSI